MPNFGSSSFKVILPFSKYIWVIFPAIDLQPTHFLIAPRQEPLKSASIFNRCQLPSSSVGEIPKLIHPAEEFIRNFFLPRNEQHWRNFKVARSWTTFEKILRTFDTSLPYESVLHLNLAYPCPGYSVKTIFVNELWKVKMIPQYEARLDYVIPKLITHHPLVRAFNE